MLSWFPTRMLIKHAARAYGFIDPASALARLRQFSEPSEVAEPLELLRAGVIFHARGLVNTRAIQNNLDWVWPYWIERQYDPHDRSFIPRGFSFSHINLTHRNWTTFGLPDLPLYPIVDPRGLLTPHYDGWSIDVWLMGPKLELFPSRNKHTRQNLVFDPALAVETVTEVQSARLLTRCELILEDGVPIVQLQASATAPEESCIVVALRPYNPEGIQFIDTVEVTPFMNGWMVNGKEPVYFNQRPTRFLMSNYREGDVYRQLGVGEERITQKCPVGMATAAGIFEVDQSEERIIEVRIPLHQEDAKQSNSHTIAGAASSRTWKEALQDTPVLDIPDERTLCLYKASLHSILQHSAGDVVPGPYTYRRFWFRDACFILHSLLLANQTERVRLALESFPRRQKPNGFFLSQNGEWDANGQVLWICGRYSEMADKPLSRELMHALALGTDWIDEKRTRRVPGNPHSGLLPPGFSAEHFGPNDFYYWDDLWAIAGLRRSADTFVSHGHQRQAQHMYHLANELALATYTSMARIPPRQAEGAIPASPYRRFDAGAIGSIVASYPLCLLHPQNRRVCRTADLLYRRNRVGGGFFQDMVHSGINAYLTLHLAQVMLRADDPRHRELFRVVAALASPTGQWPEAIHPATGGGCMGDGHHVWASAEWFLYIRNAFVREEGDSLIIGSGILPEWLSEGRTLSFGPAITRWGRVTVRAWVEHGQTRFDVEGQWRSHPPPIILAQDGRNGSAGTASDRDEGRGRRAM